MKITGYSVRDIRFPTAKEKDGSDALNLGNYSATYVTLETDGGLKSYGPHLYQRRRQRGLRAGGQSLPGTGHGPDP